MNFAVQANVCRIAKSDEDPTIIGFTTDITVKCADCGLPFEWIGFEAGMMPDRAMVDTSAQELRAPIKPKGSLLMPGIPGFTVRAN